VGHDSARTDEQQFGSGSRPRAGVGAEAGHGYNDESVKVDGKSADKGEKGADQEQLDMRQILRTWKTADEEVCCAQTSYPLLLTCMQ